MDRREELREKMDRVSPSLCLAKWTQVTLHLHNGTNHCGYQPPTHAIDRREIAANPSALHNTAQKKEQRRRMLAGERPEECSYCWAQETANPKSSDRLTKSASAWSRPFLQEILDIGSQGDFVPRKVEINLGSDCNFKCSYCTPAVSSRWRSEIKELGPYPTSTNYNSLLGLPEEFRKGAPNPYLEAWWKWWPELSKKLLVFRITGGEPLLQDSLFRILADILAEPKPNLELAVNTNLCPPEDRWKKFLSLAAALCEEKAVREFTVFTSADAWGKQAEYIRYGMDFFLWLKRVEEFLHAIPAGKIKIMATYNALSAPSFGRLLEEVLRIKQDRTFARGLREYQLEIDVHCLVDPPHQSIFLLPPHFASVIEQQVAFMRAHQGMDGFSRAEIEKLESVFQLFLSHIAKKNEHSVEKADLLRFLLEHDRRRGTDFQKTFPELREIFTIPVGV